MFFLNKRKTQSQDAVIHIADVLAPVVNSRDVAASLEEYILKSSAEKISLDFSHVDFISRSAAHQLLLLKEKFSHTAPKKDIVFENTNNDVKEMFRIIAANRAVPERMKPRFEAEKITIDALSKIAAK